jgi:fructan beta-fructosidase
MSNWTYANDVPTSPWRSAMTVPRELRLHKTADGIRLMQKPVHELQALRGPRQQFPLGNIAAANDWVKKNRIESVPLELSVVFEPGVDEPSGMKLFKGKGEETIIGVDRKQGRVYLDRTKSGNVAFHPKFAGVQSAALAARDQPVKLHIFADACSVEVFINDGEQTITALTFPAQESRGIEFFGPEKAIISALDAWTMASGWQTR